MAVARPNMLRAGQPGGPYLALGYKLARLREKLEAA